MPDSEPIVSGRHSGQSKPPVTITYLEPGARADNNISAHVMMNITRKLHHARVGWREIQRLSRRHRLIDRVTGRDHVHIVRFTVLVGESNGSSQRDRLHPRHELEPALIHQRQISQSGFTRRRFRSGTFGQRAHPGRGDRRQVDDGRARRRRANIRHTHHARHIGPVGLARAQTEKRLAQQHQNDQIAPTSSPSHRRSHPLQAHARTTPKARTTHCN